MPLISPHSERTGYLEGGGGGLTAVLKNGWTQTWGDKLCAWLQMAMLLGYTRWTAM